MTPETRSFLNTDTEAVERMQQALGLWESNCRIWFDYVMDCCTAPTPQAWFDAQTRFVTRVLDAPGLAAGEIQRDDGLKGPTLAA